MLMRTSSRARWRASHLAAFAASMDLAAGCSTGDALAPRAGSVLLVQEHSTAGLAARPSAVATLLAQFPVDPASTSRDDEADAGCAPERYGACQVHRCFAPIFPSAPTAPALHRDAGTLRIDGLRGDVGSIAHVDQSAYTARSTTPWWTGGERVTVAATGAAGGVAAFSTTLIAPGLIEVFAPTGDTQVAAREALVVSWSAQADTTVHVRLVSDVSPRREVTCDFDGASGSGTVPRDAMLALQPATVAQIDVVSRRDRIVAAGDQTVSVSLVDLLPTMGFRFR